MRSAENGLYKLLIINELKIEFSAVQASCGRQKIEILITYKSIGYKVVFFLPRFFRQTARKFLTHF